MFYYMLGVLTGLTIVFFCLFCGDGFRNNQPKKKFLVLISGWKGSGKDTFVNRISNKFEFQRFAFADELKNFVSEVFQISREDMDHVTRKENPLPEFPVIIKDSFSKDIVTKLVAQTKTLDNKAPKLVKFEQDGETVEYYDFEVDKEGNCKSDSKQLYWTPRGLLILYGCVFRSVDPNWWVKKSAKMNSYPYVAVSDWRFPNEAFTMQKLFPNHKLICGRIDVEGPCPSKDPSETALDDFNFDFRILNKKTGLNEFYHDIDEEMHGKLFD